MIPTPTRFRRTATLLCCLFASTALAQDAPIFTGDFPAEEFQARREAVLDAVGPGGVAVLQGAGSPLAYQRFRQTNSFYYLTGVETPHAYLLLDGASRRSVLYLPHRNARREASEGRLLTAEDAESARELTGVDDVFGTWKLSDDLARMAWGNRPPTLYTPLSPAELAAMSRDLATRGNSDIANDPWDGRPSREANFAARLRDRFPKLDVEDLSPVLDRLRLIKSEREVALIRKATDLSGLGIMEAIRSTRPGIYEHELDAVAKFIFFRDGAQSEAYYSLVATGTNAWYPHYHRGASRLEDGDLVLMDYAPDIGYYTSDVTRMWPVNGVFSEWQRDLYGFYLACYRAILDAIRPGDVATIMGEAATRMEELARTWPFTRSHYRPAAEAFAAAVGALGVCAGDHVVCYATYGIGTAPRAWWMFRLFGHERVSVLDGGLPAWTAGGGTLDKGPARPRPRAFQATFNPARIRDLAAVRANLEAATELVVDARSAGRFAGTETEPRPGLRGGHIPESVNLPYQTLLDGPRMLAPEVLRARLEAAGVAGDRPPVFTCGSGVSACTLALGLTLTGRDDWAVYDGSWSEWGGREDVPVTS